MPTHRPVVTDCEHIGFEHEVVVARLTEVDGGPVTGYSADLKIRCAMCHTSFEFIGVPGGLSPSFPTTNPLCTELRIPIRPPDG